MASGSQGLSGTWGSWQHLCSPSCSKSAADVLKRWLSPLGKWKPLWPATSLLQPSELLWENITLFWAYFLLMCKEGFEQIVRFLSALCICVITLPRYTEINIPVANWWFTSLAANIGTFLHLIYILLLTRYVKMDYIQIDMQSKRIFYMWLIMKFLS